MISMIFKYSRTCKIKFVHQLTFAKWRYRSFFSDSSQADRRHPRPSSTTTLHRLSGSAAARQWLKEIPGIPRNEWEYSSRRQIKISGKTTATDHHQRWRRGYTWQNLCVHPLSLSPSALRAQDFRIRSVLDEMRGLLFPSLSEIRNM